MNTDQESELPDTAAGTDAANQMRLNPLLDAVVAPPIAQAQSWLPEAHDSADGLMHKPLLDLAQAVPGYPPAQSLMRFVSEAALQPQSAAYTPILGLPALRAALAEDLSRHYQARLSSRQVAITAGCNQAFCAALSVLAGPGDEVVLTVPYYFNHQMWLAMNGIKPVLLACDPENGLPDVQACAALIGPRTRALVMVSPNNPTGAIYPDELLQALARLAHKNGIALVLDETYRDFVCESAPPHQLFCKVDWPQYLISLHSFSKSFSLPGYRVGGMAASPRILAAAEKFLDCAAICPSHLSQLSAQFALQQLHQWRGARATQMRERAAAFTQMFSRNELRYTLISAGAFFAYVRHPFMGEPALAVAKRLAEQQNMLCLPGTMFGPGQEPFLRFSFSNVDQARFAELLERLLDSQTLAAAG